MAEHKDPGHPEKPERRSGERRSYQGTWRRFDRRSVASGAVAGTVLTLVPGAAGSAAATGTPLLGTPVGSSGSPERAPETAANPLLADARFFVDPELPARSVASQLRGRDATRAQAAAYIADRPQGSWFGDWNRDIRGDVNRTVARAARDRAMPVLVAYNIPNRDCNQYSSGGVGSAAEYRSWIRAFAAGIGASPAIVVLEPDATALISCLTPEKQQERMSLLKEAVETLKSNPNTVVYIDAGHADWVDTEEMAMRLHLAGIERADGFALNVSNFVSTQRNVAYGEQLGRRLGGKHFVIDTSRNGGNVARGEWCNPTGAALGQEPTTRTGHPMADAFLWIKRPGESDGQCNGGPRAGEYWADYAVGLVRGAGRLG
jgi:endoglucanase